MLNEQVRIHHSLGLGHNYVHVVFSHLINMLQLMLQLQFSKMYSSSITVSAILSHCHYMLFIASRVSNLSCEYKMMFVWEGDISARMSQWV